MGISNRIRLSLLVFTLVSCSKVEERPNILLIVADDLGYADLGCFGGDIQTPHIDSLATRGVLFTQFHTAPYCAPSRAMLLTGANNHMAGMGRQGGAREGSWQFGVPGYEGHLSDRVVSVSEILRSTGYHTYTVGKWHLGTKDELAPAAKGFERSFNLLQGAGNHYNNMGLFKEDSISFYSSDGRRVPYPEGKYSTEFYTDKLMEFIRNGKDGKPFFAYAAFTSPHWPLQSPPEFDRYKGRYDMGYDSLRVLRIRSLKKAGIISQDAVVPPRLESIKKWEELTADEKRIESRKMELYAAMVDNLDFHVGRLIQFLRKEGLLEKTRIVFMSDNGAAAEDFYNVADAGVFLRTHYHNEYSNMGQPNSFISYGPPWAKAGAAPFNRHKSFTTEGGTIAPLIFSGQGIGVNGIHSELVTVMDLAPTFLEWAGRKPGELPHLAGASLAAYLDGKSKSAHTDDYAFGLEHDGRMFFRKGKWKLVNMQGPYDEKSFELYDLSSDPAETTDVAPKEVVKLEEMKAGWREYMNSNGIIVGPPLR